MVAGNSFAPEKVLGEYDYVIVGAGSAGCVLANRLSADPDIRVLLVETGQRDRNFWLKLPVGYFRSIYDARFSRIFETEGSEGDGFRGIPWPRGRVVGGSSSINGLIFIRGQHEDFDDWAEMGAEGWSYDEVLPAFKSIETYAGGDDRYHGRSGPMPVSDLRNDHPVCAAWLDAAKRFGLPANSDFNGATSYGVGRYQLTLGRRLRASASSTFLRPALRRPNLSLIIGAHISRIVIENGCATAIEWREKGETVQARARRDVIVSAGSLQTPQLLQLSGIGPAGLLNRLGVPVHVDASEVGANLQDHYQMRVILQLNDNRSLNADIRRPTKLAQMGLQWLMQGRGPLTVGAGQVGGGACTKFADGGRPDIQFNVMPLSVDKPGTPLHDYPGFTASVWQCHPQSHGDVQITSTDPLAAPRIRPDYFVAPHDRKVIVEGVRILRDIHRQQGFKTLWSHEVTSGSDKASDDEIWEAVRNLGGTVFHQVGTCRMGSDAGAVVDPRLKVQGIAGLRVVDASIMPKITSANTNAATLMLAEKAAGIILEDAGRGRQS